MLYRVYTPLLGVSGGIREHVKQGLYSLIPYRDYLPLFSTNHQ